MRGGAGWPRCLLWPPLLLAGAAVEGKLLAVKKWRLLGPFIIGKNELDGEPWHISNASELVPGGLAKSKKLLADETGALLVDWPDVDWQSLSRGVGGREVLEWQALARGYFKIDKEGPATVACRGVSAFQLDDKPARYVGDQYRAGLPGNPVHLTAGAHRLSIRLRSVVRAQLSCQVEIGSTTTPRVFGGQYLSAPDFLDDRLASDLFVVPLANGHPQEWLRKPRAVQVDSRGLELAEEQPSALSLAPGQQVRFVVRVRGKGQCPKGGAWLKVAVEGEQVGEKVRSDTATIKARCRSAGQSFQFTYFDADGSLQLAAAVAPAAAACEEGPGCPVLLTLHGTSISASDSADSYKMKGPKDEDYRFGVANAWLLAPSRHGAHNWEGPGLESALAALRALPAVASGLALPAADTERVLVAGHSMGGHGAWLLAGRLRGVALGVAGSASWLRKDQYSDSNKVMLHDVANFDVEPALQALLHSAESEYDAESLAPTLAGLRILIRVGSADMTVHPWYSRRMHRALLASGAEPGDVQLTEVPNMEHWWWDTVKPNDGGVVNDAQMRDFFKLCLTQPKELPESWRLVLHNPAEGGKKGGLSVLRQLVPHRRSEVLVRAGQQLLELETRNVQRMHWDSSSPLACSAGGCTWRVDDQDLSLTPGQAVELCRTEGGHWGLCGADARPARVLGTLGPMRRLFTAPTCAVVDESSYPSSAALYVANLLIMTGHGQLAILTPSEVLGADGSLSPPEACQNLLVIGTPAKNPVAAALLKPRADLGYEPPLAVSGSSISLGGCTWKGDTLAVLSLLPWWRAGEQRLALLATGSSSLALSEAVGMLATPTIPPMTRQPFTHLLPDYVVLDHARTRARGAGGFLAAGFWGHLWQYEARAAWEGFCTRATAEPVARARSDEL